MRGDVDRSSGGEKKKLMMMNMNGVNWVFMKSVNNETILSGKLLYVHITDEMNLKNPSRSSSNAFDLIRPTRRLSI